MRVLVSAYACQPGAGSEPGVGWNVVVQMAQRHEVWVITREDARAGIEAALRSDPQPNLHFVYHFPRWLGRIKSAHLRHYLWQLSLAPVGRSLHQSHDFDLAHQVTYGSFRHPSGLQGLGIPLVLGPVGGAEEPPLSFWWEYGVKGFLVELARSVSNRIARVDPMLRRTYAAAQTILVTTPETGRLAQSMAGPHTRIEIMPSIGVPDDQPAKSGGARSAGGEVQALFVARLVHWKGTHLAIRALALAHSRAPALRLTVLGKGPRAASLRKLARRLGVADCVRFVERLPTLDDVFALYAQSDLFIFPSLHEAGGMAVIEAMCAGLPVVCLNLGGPGLSVTAACGFAVPAAAPAQAVAAMADAMVRLGASAETRRQLGEQARQRVLAEYTWSRKGELLDTVYHAAVGRRT